MKKIILFILIYVICLNSCGPSINENNIKLSQSDAENAEPPQEPLINTIGITKSNSITRIDSSKFVRAFDDIYFGNKSQKFKSIYYLNNVSYSICESSYSIEHELCSFKLLSQYAYLQSSYPSIRDELISVISLKYSSGKKYYEKIDGVIDRTFARNMSNDNGASQPKDWYDIIYIHKWEKNGIVIKLGYKIDYDTKLDNKALFRPILSFLYLPYSKQSKQILDSIQKGEANKF
jgi:hypothetical protein